MVTNVRPAKLVCLSTTSENVATLFALAMLTLMVCVTKKIVSVT